MNHLLPHPVLTPILTIIWLLLANSMTPGHIILGLLLGWSIPMLSTRFWPETITIYKPMTLLRYIGIVIYDIVIANFIVARLILGSPNRLHPVFVAIPLELESELAISLLASCITLTPGTLSASLSPDNKTLLVHALNETDPDALILGIKQRYEKPLKEIFEQPC